MGCLVANALAPVIVNKDSDIPFMVCSLLQSVLSQSFLMDQTYNIID